MRDPVRVHGVFHVWWGKKPDGSVRFITDFRKVNSVTVPDSYPLPRMEDCVDNLGSAKFVSKLHLLKRYWQVLLTERASKISAFVTPDHFLEYTVMAFGMCNTPATFQRLVNLVLSGVSNCNAYLDDLIVYNNTWKEHMQTLKQVFSCLTLNFAKCDFGKAAVTYLGREVGQGQVRPLEAKICAVTMSVRSLRIEKPCAVSSVWRVITAVFVATSLLLYIL